MTIDYNTIKNESKVMLKKLKQELEIKNSEIQVKSVIQLIIMCQCQFPGFHNVLCRMLSFGENRFWIH